MEKTLQISPSNLMLQKCNERDGGDPYDLISKLPDEVLVSMLSFLRVKDAASTSVLSKRWEHLWKFTTRLDFDTTEFVEQILEFDALGADRCRHYILGSLYHCELCKQDKAKYIKLIPRVLKVHMGSILEQFRICFGFGKEFKHEVDDWLRFALARGVQRLELDLTHNRTNSYEFWDNYDFPSEFLPQCNSPLVTQPHAGLRSCNIVGLKEIILKRVDVSGEVLQFFLSNCLHLERLVVRGSQQLVKLEVSGTSLRLRSLEITDCHMLKTILVSNANLVSFKYEGANNLEYMEFLLDNLPSLVEVFIGWCGIVYAFSKLSSVLSQLEILTLCSFDTTDYAEELQRFPNLNRLKRLTLISGAFDNVSLLGFATMMKLSPNLHKFVLQQQHQTVPPQTAGYKPKMLCDYPHHNLKVVELAGYYGHWRDVELAMYILRNASRLERLIIDPRDPYTGPVQFDDPNYGPSQWKVYKGFAEENGRTLAKEHLARMVPSHVALEVL